MNVSGDTNRRLSPAKITSFGATKMRAINQQEKPLTLKEVAEYLSVTRRTVYRWIHEGQLKAFRAGNEWRIAPDAIEEFVEVSD